MGSGDLQMGEYTSVYKIYTLHWKLPPTKKDPLVYLKNTPQMEPRIMKTVNELNNAPLELISP